MTNNDIVTVNIAKQFTKWPGGRYKKLGRYSGEEFRERFLTDPLRDGKKLVVELDGGRGYGSSFLEEAFGGVVRELSLDPEDAIKRIHIVTSLESWRLDIEDYIRNAHINKANEI